MLVYLDSSHLIDILEGCKPCSVEDLSRLLKAGSHRLVVSATTVMELAAPLGRPGSKTNVMRLLNRLEELPLTFLADARIERLELEEATRAWEAAEEPQPVSPFVSRFDETLPPIGRPPTAPLMNFSIAEAVFWLWTENRHSFRGFDPHLPAFEKAIEADRALSAPLAPKAHFRIAMGRDLALYRFRLPTDLDAFADWVYAGPSRSPSRRLSFELWRQLVADKTCTPRVSDFGDLMHLRTLPYVDCWTGDGRTTTYVRQASRKLKLAYGTRVHHRAEEALAVLREVATVSAGDSRRAW